MRPEKGVLIVLSGPSGSGKGTLVKKLLEQRDDTVLSVSVTTRQPRPGEIEGVHYYFRTRKQVEEMIAEGSLLEYAEYNGHYYGTPEPPIKKWLEAGKNVLLEIEVQGAEKVMNHRSDLVSIFITIPSMEELERRHISVTRRREMGADIQGACGQLRRRFLAEAGQRAGDEGTEKPE